MPASLERIYDEHAQALFAFLLNFTRSEPDTRDVLQEVFGKIAARPGLLDGARDERAFLLRLVHNMAVDLIRRRSTREKNHDEFSTTAPRLFADTTNADETCFHEALAAA